MIADGRRTLWVGRLPERCDIARDLPFGVGAIVGRDAYAARLLAHDPESEDNADADEMAEAERLVAQKFQQEFLDPVAAPLQAATGDAHSAEFWSIALSPVLMFLIHVSYLNQRLAERYVARYGQEHLDVLVPSRAPFVGRPATASELVDLIMNSEFHAWVAAQHLRALAPASWAIRPRDTEPFTFSPIRDRTVADVLKWPIRRFLANLRCTSEELPVMWRLVFGCLLSVRQVANGDRPRPALSRSPAASTRGDLAPGFADRTRSLIDACLPLSYREGFPQRYARLAKRSYRAGHGRLVAGSIYDDEANLLKAIAVERGEVVYTVQHGGGYGTLKVFPLSPESEYLGGPFISWGWREHESYSVAGLPLPSPALSRLKAARARVVPGREIVFIGAAMSPFLLRIHSKPIGVQWLDYREQKVAFLNELSPQAFGAIRYRGHEHAALTDGEFLRGHFPTLRLSQGDFRELHRLLSAARLCVVDHPITAFHQVMAMNVPTVAYWNHDHWRLARQAVPLFAELEAVGIVHRSGREAGRFLTERLDRIEGWWGDERVQVARRRWCDVYARTSPHWASEWAQAIWENPRSQRRQVSVAASE